jgi:hypothetical protein
VAAFIMMIVIYWLFRKATPAHMDTWFKKVPLRKTQRRRRNQLTNTSVTTPMVFCASLG